MRSHVYAAKDILYALHKFSRAVYFEYEYANDAFSIGREQISLEKACACVKSTEMFTGHMRFKRKWFGKYLDEGRQNIKIYTRGSYVVAATIMNYRILRMTRMGETRKTYKKLIGISLVKRPLVKIINDV